MEKANKKRSTNFSAKEENILISLVQKYKDQIECKRSDTNTNKIKLTAWKRVTDEFNSISGENYRHLQILRNKYDNLKKRSKQKYADEKSFLKKTGGGPPRDFTFDDIDNGIKDIIGTQMTGLPSDFDGDYACNGDMVEVMDNEMDISDLSVQINDETEKVEFSEKIDNIQPLLPFSLNCQVASSSRDISNGTTVPLLLEHNYTCSDMTTGAKTNKDWSKYTPDMLREEISSPLRSTLKKVSCSKKENKLKKNRNPLNSKLVEWSSSKIELAEIQKTAFSEEHQLKLKHMQEKHDQMMRLQQAESVMKMKFLEEEHDMNMSLLEVKKRLLNK